MCHQLSRHNVELGMKFVFAHYSLISNCEILETEIFFLKVFVQLKS